MSQMLSIRGWGGRGGQYGACGGRGRKYPREGREYCVLGYGKEATMRLDFRTSTIWEGDLKVINGGQFYLERCVGIS
jgi:hypothetical protein